MCDLALKWNDFSCGGFLGFGDVMIWRNWIFGLFCDLIQFGSWSCILGIAASCVFLYLKESAASQCQVCGVKGFITGKEQGQGVVLWASSVCIFISGELERAIYHPVFPASRICCNLFLRFFARGKFTHLPFIMRCLIRPIDLTSLVVCVVPLRWLRIWFFNFLKNNFVLPLLHHYRTVTCLRSAGYCIFARTGRYPWYYNTPAAALVGVPLCCPISSQPCFVFHYLTNMKQVGLICIDSRLNELLCWFQTNWLTRLSLYFSCLLCGMRLPQASSCIDVANLN